LDLIGLVDRITAAEINIDSGRKGFTIRGKEQLIISKEHVTLQKYLNIQSSLDIILRNE